MNWGQYNSIHVIKHVTLKFIEILLILIDFNIQVVN